jgi:hypothetical protein
MDYSNRKFVIISSDEVSSVDFSLVLINSADTLRYNNDNTKTFVKFDQDTTPSFLDGKTQYGHEEFLEILNDENGEWYEDIDIDNI